jgi:hypothetical protein
LWYYLHIGPTVIKRTTKGLSCLKTNNIARELHIDVSWAPSDTEAKWLNRLYNFTRTETVFDGCETWSLNLSKGHRLRVYENRVLRRIYGSKRKELTGSWKKLHNEDLHNMNFSPNSIRVTK